MTSNRSVSEIVERAADIAKRIGEAVRDCRRKGECVVTLNYDTASNAVTVLGVIAASSQAQSDDVVELRQKLRMIISHASGGHLSEPEDVDRSTNDIAVEISRHVSRVWEQAQQSALRDAIPPAGGVEEMRERIARLEFEVAQRGMALMPFAEACSDCIDETECDSAYVWEHPVGMQLTVRDFREARATLNVGGGDGR